MVFRAVEQTINSINTDCLPFEPPSVSRLRHSHHDPLRVKVLSAIFNLTDFLHFHAMCEWACKTYAACTRTPKHMNRDHIIFCTLARSDANDPCVPPSGFLRDLPLVLDAQDTNIAGSCPPCAGTTPTNSSD